MFLTPLNFQKNDFVSSFKEKLYQKGEYLYMQDFYRKSGGRLNILENFRFPRLKPLPTDLIVVCTRILSPTRKHGFNRGLIVSLHAL
jgi:hypothetical protein